MLFPGPCFQKYKSLYFVVPIFVQQANKHDNYDKKVISLSCLIFFWKLRAFFCITLTLILWDNFCSSKVIYSRRILKIKKSKSWVYGSKYSCRRELSCQLKVESICPFIIEWKQYSQNRERSLTLNMKLCDIGIENVGWRPL